MAAANLSLLSRGIGEVSKNGNEKIDVKLEPEDYHNWLNDPRREWNVSHVIPPIHDSLSPRLVRKSGNAYAPPPTQAFGSQDFTPRSYISTDSLKHSEVYLPKTFTTRKGALLLFSEDLARRSNKRRRKRGHRLTQSADTKQLTTVEDLAKSILSYGAAHAFSQPENAEEEEESRDEVYMGFVHSKARRYYERQYKPGFSAKRYLASWTKLWDHSLFNNISNKGYMKLNTQLLKKSDYDISGLPLPYRILRQWLYAPGTLDGYTFYRQKQPSFIKEATFEEEDGRPVTAIEEAVVGPGEIVITSINKNMEVDYAQLDWNTKESILTELLVKSAITHAIKKQKEFQEAIATNTVDEEARKEADAQLMEFDMMKAIQSALDQPPLVVPSVKTLSIDESRAEAMPVPTVQQKGFRGTRGIGVKFSSEGMTGSESMTGSMVSLDSVGSDGWPADKYKKLPPIGKPSRQPGALNMGSIINAAPGARKPPIPVNQPAPFAVAHALPTGSSQDLISINIEPPTPQHSFVMSGGFKGSKKSAQSRVTSAPMLEEDEEYTSWGDSALSGDHQSSSLNKSKSQSMQSIHTINMEAEIRSISGSDRVEVRPKEFILDLPLRQVANNITESASLPSSPRARTKRMNALHHSNSLDELRAKPSSTVTPESAGAPIQPFAEALDALNKIPKKLTSSERLINELEARILERSVSAEPRSEGIGASIDRGGRQTGSRPSDADNLAAQPGVGSSEQTRRGSTIELLSQVGLESDDENDKKSVLSMASIMSRRSRISSSGYDGKIPYKQGITARQDPTSMLKVSTEAGDFDPGAAITSWKYNVEVETVPPIAPPDVEPIILAESPLSETASSFHKSGGNQSAAKSANSGELSPFSVPAHSDGRSPVHVPTAEPSETASVVSETEFLNVITEQAREIARNVLNADGDAGLDLASDAKKAAEMLMSNLPSNAGMDQSGTETGDEAVAEESVLQAEGQGSDLTVGEVIKGSMEELVHHIEDLKAEDSHRTSVTASRISSSKLSPSKLSPSKLSPRPDSNEAFSIPSEAASTPTIVPTPPSSHRAGSTRPVSEVESLRQSVPSAASALTPSTAVSRVTSAASSEVELATSLQSGMSAVSSRPASAVAQAEVPTSVPLATAETPADVPESSKQSRVTSAASSLQIPEAGVTTSVASVSSAKVETPGGAPERALSKIETPEKVLSAKSTKSPGKGSQKDSKVEHEAEFVVGKVKDKVELQTLYAPVESPPKPKEKKPKVSDAKKKVSVSKKEKPSPAKKGKAKPKVKAKQEKAAPPPKEKTATPPPPKTPTPEPVKEPTPPPLPTPPAESPEIEEWKTPEPEEEEEMEFIIVREESDSEEEPEPKPGLGSVKSLNYSKSSGTSKPGSSRLTTDDEPRFDYSEDEDLEDTGVSNKDAQAAKRAAAKEKRRREVERRRREREEALKKEKEDAERKERIRLQMEEERMKRDEELRLKKEREREEKERLEREEDEKIKREREALERERRKQEEMARYMAEKRRRAEEEESRRRELQAQREAEEQERLRQEQQMLEEMAEEERAEYLRKKAEEARLRAIAEEEARIRREEEAKRIWEELEKQEEERRRAEEILRQRLLFQRSLNVESQGMSHTQDISRAFVFSYYELLKWLGYEIPEWAQYGPTPGDPNQHDHSSS